jgi:hypothetical protein
MALLDTIRKNMAGVAAQQQQPALGQTERIQKILQKRATGKAGVAEAGPQQSAIAEEAAQVQTGQALQQIQKQGTLAAQQLGQRQKEMEQRSQQQRQKLEQERKAADATYRRQADKIINDLSRENRQLSMEKDGAKLEQLGHTLAMQDKQYVHNLRDTGRRQRLTNENNFEIALQKDIWADMQSLFKDEIDLNEFLELEEREFQKKIMKLDVKDALKVWEAQKEAAGKQAIWSALGGGTSAVTAAYGDSMQKEPTKETTPETAGVGTNYSPAYGFEEQ